jgi:hypothetical protein
MSLWWSSLTGSAQFYWTIAIFATALQLLLLFGTLLGGHFDSGHGDGGADTSGDTESHSRFLSLRVLIAFFVGFGWAGVLGLQQGMSGLSTAMASLVTGVIFMFLLAGTLRFLLAMRADGTLNYQNAVGQSGQVYVTIPPARSGPGQVEIMLQGRLITASALTDATMPLTPRTPIEVTAVDGATTLIVQPATLTPTLS